MTFHKRFCFIVILIIFHFKNIIAQDTRHIIGISFSPDYSIGLTPNGVLFSPGFHTRYKDKPVFGNTATGYFNYYFKKKLSVIIGIAYSKKGCKREFRHRSLDDFIFHPGETEEIAYRFIEFPLKLKYDVKVSDKVTLFAATGVGYTLVRESLQTITYPAPNPAEYVFNNTAYEKNNINLYIGIGVDIKVASSWVLTINPEHRKMRNEPFFGSGRRIYSPGMNTGLKFIL